MAVRTAEIALTFPELREVARYAAGCAQSVLLARHLQAVTEVVWEAAFG